MNYDGNWAGNSQKDMANSLQVLVEMTPQLPLDKLGYQAQLMRKRLKKYLAHVLAQRKPLAPLLCDEAQETAY